MNSTLAIVNTKYCVSHERTDHHMSCITHNAAVEISVTD